MFMTEHDYSSLSPARFFPRFLAFVIDVTMIFGIIGMTVLVLLMLRLTSLALGMQASPSQVLSNAIDDSIISLEPALHSQTEITAALLTLILLKWFVMITVPVYVLYSAGYEMSAKQATPGKTAMHIIVTGQEGRPIGIFQSFGRTVAKILFIIPLGIGMLPLIFSQNGWGLHDYCTRTRVVKGEPDLQVDAVALGRSDKIFQAILMLLLLIMWYKYVFSL